MGSTLTNTQPKDTYKSLLKTSDSTELSATAKYVSDGNGNDSPLALSTSKVGIGDSNPTFILDVNNTGSRVRLKANTGDSNIELSSIAGRDWLVSSKTDGAFSIYDEDASAERLRITSDGYVRLAAGTSGIQFGGDTAAANALDDYEEGTFTPTYASGLTGVTYTNTSGRYTKIGNRVMFDLRIQASAVGGTSGALIVGGLPFATNGAYISNATIGYFGVYSTDVIYALLDTGTTDAILFYKKDATNLLGSELTANTSAIHISGVYSV